MQLAARFATHAARSGDLRGLQHEICRVAADGLGVRFAKLLVYKPDEDAFLIQAGVGWRDGVVGRERLSADSGTAAGFAWRTGQAILSNDLLTQRRFRTPSVLVEHGIVRSINVVVPSAAEEGAEAAAYGVLEAESPEPGRFVQQDAHFLQILAYSLASAAAARDVRHASRVKAAHETDAHKLSLQEMQHRVRNDLQGVIISVAGEARLAGGPIQRAGFERVNRRIMALAGLYDHLLRGHDEDRVDLGTYLRSLCARIADAGGYGARDILLTADTQMLAMSRDRAVRLAIAINELVANAAAHAFPSGRRGAITVRLRVRDDGGAALTVSDDGQGFQGPRAGGAGLLVVRGLAAQAGAVLTREDGPGTRWRVEWEGGDD